MSAMNAPQTPPDAANPLLADWTGPFGLPPFAAFSPERFRPAFDAALSQHRAEIDAVAADPAAPTFENTIEALERGGRALERVASVFFVLAGADTSDAIEEVERDVSPLLARHGNAIYLNRALYARIADLYARRDSLGLTPEQDRVLDRYYTRFVRAGAALEKPAQDKLAAINERLASLGTSFGQNVLADEKAYELLLDEADLDGLPDFARAGARATAQERGKPGKYAFTLSRSSVEPFLQFSARRDLREKIFKAWIKRGENGGATDNRAIIKEMVALRAERAKLLGFDTFADYRLDDQMAKTPAAARELLENVWTRARAKAHGRARRLAENHRRRGRQFRAGALGLALLRRAAAQGRIRFGRGRDQALFPARQDGRGRLRDRAPAVRPHLHARRCAALSQGCARLGCEGRERQRDRACSSATITRAAPSTPAPG